MPPGIAQINQKYPRTRESVQTSDFARPSLAMSRGHRDFDRGLYLAEEERDAIGCCLKGNAPYGFLHVYEVDEDRLLSLPGATCFDRTDDGWLRTIYECRMFGEPSGAILSVISGPTAGHEVNRLFKAYRRDGVSFSECRDALAEGIVTDRFGIQWCLKSEDAIAMLVPLDCERIWRDDDDEDSFLL